MFVLMCLKTWKKFTMNQKFPDNDLDNLPSQKRISVNPLNPQKKKSFLPVFFSSKKSETHLLLTKKSNNKKKISITSVNKNNEKHMI